MDHTGDTASGGDAEGDTLAPETARRLVAEAVALDAREGDATKLA